jgi:glycosyltransferase involved in cell wall biosynthesis
LFPLISCIVPVYNGEKYLAEAIESILAQSYRPLEVIIVDAGSTDDTPQVVAGFKDRVVYLEQSNRGPSATRNLGVSASRGDFVAFLDPDDLWHPDKLARQMGCFEACPELDLCVAHVKLFWAAELQGEAMRLRGQARGNIVPGFTTGTLLTRRKFFYAVGDFDAALWFGDATDWFLRAANRRAVMELLPDVLLYHRMHATNLTRRRIDASRDEFLGIVKRSLDYRRHAGRRLKSLQFPRASGRGPMDETEIAIKT